MAYAEPRRDVVGRTCLAEGIASAKILRSGGVWQE